MKLHKNQTGPEQNKPSAPLLSADKLARLGKSPPAAAAPAQQEPEKRDLFANPQAPDPFLAAGEQMAGTGTRGMRAARRPTPAAPPATPSAPVTVQNAQAQATVAEKAQPVVAEKAEAIKRMAQNVVEGRVVLFAIPVDQLADMRKLLPRSFKQDSKVEITDDIAVVRTVTTYWPFDTNQAALIVVDENLSRHVNVVPRYVNDSTPQDH